MKLSKISSDFLQKYEIIETENKPYLISNFRCIGWSDPFPDDDLKIIGSVDDDAVAKKINDIEDYVYDK